MACTKVYCATSTGGDSRSQIVTLVELDRAVEGICHRVLGLAGPLLTSCAFQRWESFTLSTCERHKRVRRSQSECKQPVTLFSMTRSSLDHYWPWGGISTEGRTHLCRLGSGTLTANRYQDELLGLTVRSYIGALSPGFLWCMKIPGLMWREHIGSLWRIKELMPLIAPTLTWPKSNRIPPGLYVFMFWPSIPARFHLTHSRSSMMPCSRSGRRSLRTPSVIWWWACHVVRLA